MSMALWIVGGWIVGILLAWLVAGVLWLVAVAVLTIAEMLWELAGGIKRWIERRARDAG